MPGPVLDFGPNLYHALSSYYSMIARLALVEGGMSYESTVIDIHFKMVIDGDTKSWLDLHCGYPIEELTFGGFLARSPMARI